MANNEAGKVRQSAVIMNYGPGAIIDFRVPGTGAAISVVAGGLEQWVKQSEEQGASAHDMKRLTEPRLAEKLGVKYFRLPPVAPDNPKEDDIVIPLVGARFPGWLQCPQCSTIKVARRWGHEAGNPSRFCSPCSNELGPDETAYVVPVRFVLACRGGHLADFPWVEWVHNGSRCPNKKEFKLKSEGPGLAGLILSCPKCKKRRSMEHVFSRDAHKDSKCSGERPWLPDGNEECSQPPVTLQRGASNLYFPQMESALVIPPWSEEIVRQLGYRWNEIATIVDQVQRSQYIDIKWDDISMDIGDIDKSVFKELVEEKVADSKKASSGNLRWDEYQQFMVAGGHSSQNGNEFEIRVEKPAESIPHISHLLRVVSLRELRALRSFTRIEPLPGVPPVRSQFLSHHNMGWLPAIEVRGEGIFIALNNVRLEEWEANPKVIERAAQLKNYHESRVLNPDNVEMDVPPALGARFLLLHALAHVLMKQLSLQCGYSSASLRERLYVGDGDKSMAGVMVYTATSDSDGTLGGLQREGKSSRFTPMFKEAIRSNEWCSSDPLCIKGLVAATESSSLAACHSCLMAPETSCEDFNRFQDRAMLVGIPEDRSIGFFSDLLVREE